MPELPLPAQYKNSISADSPPDTAASSANTDDIPAKLSVPHEPGLDEWWRSFGNRELEELIDRGLANNPDLRIAMLRVAQAKERADQAQAGKLPTVTAPILSGLQAPAGQTTGDVPNAGGATQIQQSYQASIRANWRVDVWGEQSSMIESAKFQLWRAVFERDDTQRNMIANLSSAYVEYISLNERLKVAHENEDVLKKILVSLEKRVDAGDATLSDSAQQKAAIFALRTTMPSLEQQREDILNTIAFLVGAVPGTLTLSDNGLDSISAPSVVPGLPSALLLRRPDVRMAEARLLAADADIDVARARLLPPIDLSAQAGLSSIMFSQLLMAKSLFWNAISSLSVSIFDGGKKESDKKLSQATHEEMVETYAKVLNQAMREVEGALATIRLTGKRLDAARKATDAAREAWDISTKVYAFGGVDYQTFLDTERTYHRYLDEYQRIRMENNRGYISLFSALGGGVKSGETLPGSGSRPPQAEGGTVELKAGLVSPAPSGSTSQNFPTEGVERALGTSGTAQIENFWQVELPSLYHRSAIGAVWRDLRTRYPKFMENRFLRPRLNGRIEESENGQESWYRLYVAKFSSLASAEEFCSVLKASYQRCRIVSSRSDETAKAASDDRKSEVPVSEGATESAKAAGDSAPSAHHPAEPVAIPAAMHVDPVSTPTELPTASPVRDRPSDVRSAPGQSPALHYQKLAYTLQLGLFSNLENAGILQALWETKGYKPYIAENLDSRKRTMYAVRTGVFPTRSEASAMARSVRKKENAPVVVVSTMVDSVGKPSVIEITDFQVSGTLPVAPLLPEQPEAKGPDSNTAGPAPKAIDARESRGETPAYAVQMGAFSTMKSASVSQAFWASKGYKPYVSEITGGDGQPWYAVRTGVFSQRRQALAQAKAIGRKVGVAVIVVQVAADPSGKPSAIAERGDPVLPDSPAASTVTPDEPKAPMKASDSIAEKSNMAHPDSPQEIAYSVQMGAFSSLQAAAKSYAVWKGKGHEVYVCEMKNVKGQALFAVRQGRFATRTDAAGLVNSIKRSSRTKVIVVPAVLDGAGNLEEIDVAPLL